MGIENLFSMVKSRVAAYRKQQQALHELASMDGHQLRDIGLTPDDLVAIENGTFFEDTTRRPRPGALRPTVAPVARPDMKHAA